METNPTRFNKVQTHNQPAFDEDDFDLSEYKKAANTVTQAKAHVKRARRKVALGKIIIMVAAIAVCGLLWFMASLIVRLL